MAVHSFTANFVRGGTSNGLVILRDSLPLDKKDWQPILAGAMGSPDPNQRQLNGLGSGTSSTSKVCVIGKSLMPGIDIDYTFVQVGIKDGRLDMAPNCGNMSSAVGPVALNEGLIDESRIVDVGTGPQREARIRIYNTNTQKVIQSVFAIDSRTGTFDPVGAYEISGLPGSGSCITLSFMDPAGAKTKKTFPTGNRIEDLALANGEVIQASLVDISNPTVFVLAEEVGMPENAKPDTIAKMDELMARLELTRQAGAERMGLDPGFKSLPKLAILSRPDPLLQSSEGAHVQCQIMSMQLPHKSIPLTVAINLGVSCRLANTLAARVLSRPLSGDVTTIAHPSGTIQVKSTLKQDGGIESAEIGRTARVLMRGDVYYTH